MYLSNVFIYQQKSIYFSYCLKILRPSDVTFSYRSHRHRHRQQGHTYVYTWGVYASLLARVKRWALYPPNPSLCPHVDAVHVPTFAAGNYNSHRLRLISRDPRGSPTVLILHFYNVFVGFLKPYLQRMFQ